MNDPITFTIAGHKSSGKTELFNSIIIENFERKFCFKPDIKVEKHTKKVCFDSYIVNILETDDNSLHKCLEKSAGLIITYDLSKISKESKSHTEKLIAKFESSKVCRNSNIILVGTFLDKLSSLNANQLEEIKKIEKELSKFNVTLLNVSFSTQENIKQLNELILKSVESISKTCTKELQFLEMDDESKFK